MNEKIKKELEEFKKFKSTYEYILEEIEEIDGKEYYKGEPLIDEEGKEVGECEKWIKNNWYLLIILNKYLGKYLLILKL